MRKAIKLRIMTRQALPTIPFKEECPLFRVLEYAPRAGGLLPRYMVKFSGGRTHTFCFTIDIYYNKKTG